MLVPLAAAIGSVLAGMLLAFIPGRQAGLLGPIRSFALTASVAAVLVHLLPEAYETLGARAFVVFAFGFFLPSLLGLVAGRLGAKARPRLGLEIGFIGLLFHQLGDGLSMGALSDHGHAGHEHHDVVVAIALHTVPVAAMVVLAFGGLRNWRVSGLRAASLALCGALGVLLGYWVTSELHHLTAWVSGLTAGMVLHVVAHDLKQNPPENILSRTLDFMSALLGLGLGLWGALGHEHGHGHGESLVEQYVAVLERMLAFAYDLAPVLLIAVLLAPLAQSLVAIHPPLVRREESSLKAALAGIKHAAERPLGNLGALVLGRYSQAAHPAQLVALLLALPVLGVDSLLIAAHFLGLRLTFVLAVSTLLLAFLLASSLARARISGELDEAQIHSEISPRALELGDTIPGRFFRGLAGLLEHLGAWLVLGLFGAAALDIFVPAHGLAQLSVWWAVLGLSLLLLPSYFAAIAVIPVAAVALQKGLSPGLIIPLILLSVCLNLSVVQFFWQKLGRARTLLLILGLLLGGGLLGQIFEPLLAEAPRALSATRAPSLVQQVALGCLGLLILHRVWWRGIRGWVAELTGGYTHEHHFRGSSSG